MNERRVNSIKKLFEGVGPDRTILYTNQEIVNLCQELQKVMINGVYEKTHARYMRERDLMIHFSTLADRYGLKDTETYKRFECNMNELGYTIGSFLKGMKGERIARKALKLIAVDKKVRVLYNIALEDEDAQAEYDAIIIAPYGVFVVEVKNWGAEMCIDENGMLRRNDQDVKYDLPGRMNIKEGLLREYLGDMFPDKYQGFVLFSNENAKVRDDYKQIPICCGGGIVNKIRAFDKGTEVLTASQIEEISNKIISNHKEQKTFCRVNCGEIIEDYAVLMAAIEEAAEGTYTSVEELKNAGREIGKEQGLETMDEYPKMSDFLPTEEELKVRRTWTLTWDAVRLCIAFGVGTVVGVAAQKCLANKN